MTIKHREVQLIEKVEYTKRHPIGYLLQYNYIYFQYT